MEWNDFEGAQAALGHLGRRLLAGPGVVLVVTLRRDGSARLSPVEPLFWRGGLWLSMGRESRKARDLERDPRVLVHNVVTDREGTDGEYKIRGHAHEEHDAETQQAYADEVRRTLGWNPEPGRFHLFRVDVDEVTYIRWDSANNDQYVSRWPSAVEFVRRGTSATSLGPPEPRSELIDTDDSH
jgi:hypothetical protein